MVEDGERFFEGWVRTRIQAKSHAEVCDLLAGLLSSWTEDELLSAFILAPRRSVADVLVSALSRALSGENRPV